MSDIKLVIDCKNCIHCEFHEAYESCELRTQNRILYNHEKEAENCGYYKQMQYENGE